jgi:hypothetical protein
MRLSRLAAVSAAVALVGLTALASADTYFPNFVVPATAESAGSTYQEWNGFASVAGPNTPAAMTNTAGTANAFDATAATDGAFLTGGHIYSFSAATDPTITFSVPAAGTGSYQSVTLQAETLGNEINLSAVSLTANGGAAVPPLSETLLAQSALGGFGGFQDDYEFVWAVPVSAAGYTISFPAAEPSMSWAGARVDTATAAAVPEPASAGVLGVVLVTLARRRRR